MAERVWSEKDLARRARRRLAVFQHVNEVSGNVAATCRYYGISRTVFYRWKRRYEEEGLDGLKDRSSAARAEKYVHAGQQASACYRSSSGMIAAVLVRFAYLVVSHAFAALGLLRMTDREKDVEILALRHQLAVLHRQLGGQRPRLRPEDRALLAALLVPLAPGP